MKKTILLAVALLSLAGCQGAKPADQPNSTPAPNSTATASEGEVSGALQADVQLMQEVYYPGDQIEVMAVATNLKDSAWVGIVPTSVPHGEEKTNDANDLGYVYLKDNDRVLLVAPSEPGNYDVRLNDDDNDGKEVASRTFKLEVDPNPVAEAKLTWDGEEKVPAGETFEVQFEAPLSFEAKAWIGIVPTDTAHGEEAVGDAANLGYEHLGGRSRGSVVLRAPTTPGTYDVRFYDSDAEGKEVGSVAVTVVE